MDPIGEASREQGENDAGVERPLTAGKPDGQRPTTLGPGGAWHPRLFSLFAVLTLAGLLASSAVFLQIRRETFGAVSGLPDPSLDPRPAIFGVNADLAHAPDLDSAVSSIQFLDVTWVRQTFPWDEIEPSQGSFDWGRWDAIVDTVSTQELKLIAVLRYSPAWANGGAGPDTPPIDPGAFADFARAFAARYGDRIDVYQIWDEPNLASAWGGPPSVPGYAALLEAAYAAIHAADPNATVLLAGLAPNVETGPENLSDLLYLRRLYEFGAGPHFDAAAGKPYGYGASPLDRVADPSVLNFSRLALLRREMEAHGDSAKLLWATDFGWNALPPAWSGRPSVWGQVGEDAQAEFTELAYRRALTEWPWAGPMILESAGPALDPDDPRAGFALFNADGSPRPVAEALRRLSAEFSGLALPGVHSATDPTAKYEGAWEFSDLGADIPQDYEGARVEIPFFGSDIALKVRRGDYRGHLYVTVDGQTANAIPRDERGAYLVLTSPELVQEVVAVPVATGLPAGAHVLRIQPERGWDQWAVQGFTVGYRTVDSKAPWLLGLLLALTAGCAVGAAYSGRRVDWRAVSRPVRGTVSGLGEFGQSVAAALLSALLYLSAWLTWGQELIHVSRRLDGALPLIATAATAGLFYYSPWFLITLLSAVLLLFLFYLRLDLAFPLIALSIPFYLQPRPLFDKAFSMVEILTLLACAAWAMRWLTGLRARTASQNSQGPGRVHPTVEDANVNGGGMPAKPDRGSWMPGPLGRLTTMDWATVALVAVCGISMLDAEVRGVAIREFRVAILEPALLYFLLRTTPLDRRALWRILDFFVLGAVLVAGIGLYQYIFKIDLITAEGGVERLRSVFGSPNNVGLYLGRATGIMAAVALIARSRRRWVYLGAAAIVAPALALTFSKGALLLGVPVALGLVLVLWGGRRTVWAIGAGLAGFVALLVPLSRNPRFAGLLDFAGGTNFFRLKLWQSAVAMIRDHPILGVGPDNFLYAYRGRYILPEAWQDPNLSHPHNLVLDFTARIGLLGLAALVALQYGFWQTTAAAYRRLSSDPDLRAMSVGLMASMANFLAHGAVDVAFFIVDLSFVFFLTLGLAWRVGKVASGE